MSNFLGVFCVLTLIQAAHGATLARLIQGVVTDDNLASRASPLAHVGALEGTLGCGRVASLIELLLLRGWVFYRFRHFDLLALSLQLLLSGSV